MLRGHGPRAQAIVSDVEKEIVEWLAGGVILPDEPDDVLIIHGRPIGSTLTVAELSRTPLQLVWCVEQDAFARELLDACSILNAMLTSPWRLHRALLCTVS